MGNIGEHMGNATPTTSWHHELDWWKSPRWTVIRIQALAVVAIIISFFLASFGSCRRWSNKWIVQKGFFAAHALCLSLGAYSIGLMQSSSVKSEMYPIWTVSLFTLFGCIDPVTAYNGLDYKGVLSKTVYGICLQFGYVLLMSISTVSGGVGKTAIITLSAITFIKCFHRSLALMQQSRMRNMVQDLPDDDDDDDDDDEEEEEKEKEKQKQKEGRGGQGEEEEKEVKMSYLVRREKVLFQERTLIVDFPTGTSWTRDDVHILDIHNVLQENKDALWACYDACVAFALSHKLQRRFLGLCHHRRSNTQEPRTKLCRRIKDADLLKWGLKVIEIELAFLYDVFFTGNPFLHYYQAKIASLWAVASFLGICFVIVATAIPGTMTSRRRATSSSGPGGGCTYVVDSTTADVVITFVILVSLAMLQLMHLIRSWTSNWARVAVACAYARDGKIERNFGRHMLFDILMKRLLNFVCPDSVGVDNLRRQKKPAAHIQWWTRRKASVVTSTNWFDKYLWQGKIGQYSVLPEMISLTGGGGKQGDEEKKANAAAEAVLFIAYSLYMYCARLVKVLGLDYVWAVLRELLGGDTKKSAGFMLDDNVKASIIGFLGQIETERIDDDNWLCFANDHHPIIKRLLPHYDDGIFKAEAHGYRYTCNVMMWHLATWYCELVEQEREKQQQQQQQQQQHALSKKASAAGQSRGGASSEENQNRRVANALSKYCSYLVVSAPELLPPSPPETKRAYDSFAYLAKTHLGEDKDRILGLLSEPTICRRVFESPEMREYRYRNSDYDKMDAKFWDGVGLAKLLLGGDALAPAPAPLHGSDPWATLALVWVRLLLYAAPYGNAEAHMRRLSQGGEFITHLWALLYHLNIREWKLPVPAGNLHNITAVEDAERILNDDDDEQAVVVLAFLDTLHGHHNDELTTVSRLEVGVRFYQTSSPAIAKLFYIDPRAAKRPVLVLLNRQDKEKFSLYDGEFSACAIAYFLSAKLALANKARTQEIAPSVSDNQANKQSSEGGGQTEDEIEEEIPPLS